MAVTFNIRASEPLACILIKANASALPSWVPLVKGQAQAQPRTLNRGVCRPPVWGGHGFPSANQLPGLQFSIHPITGSLARGKLPLTQVQTVH